MNGSIKGSYSICKTFMCYPMSFDPIKSNVVTRSGLSIDEVASLLRGTPGTKVGLVVARGSDKSAIDLRATRAKVAIQGVRSSMVTTSKGTKIGVVKVRQHCLRVFTSDRTPPYDRDMNREPTALVRTPTILPTTTTTTTTTIPPNDIPTPCNASPRSNRSAARPRRMWAPPSTSSASRPPPRSCSTCATTPAGCCRAASTRHGSSCRTTR